MENNVIDFNEILFNVSYQINNCCEDFWDGKDTKNYFILKIGAFLNELYNSNWWDWFCKEYKESNCFIYNFLNDSINREGFYDINLFCRKLQVYFRIICNADIVDDNLRVQDWDKFEDFEYESFVKKIDVAKISDIGNFKSQITNTALVYGINLKDMIDLFYDSINNKGIFDFDILNKKAMLLFAYRQKKDEPLQTSDNEMCNFLENSTASVILTRFFEKEPNAKQLSIVNEIYSKIDLPKGVLNCMILKVLKDKNGELPSINYFKKMADSWINDGIVNTNEAIKYVTNKKDVTSKKTEKSGSENIKKGQLERSDY